MITKYAKYFIGVFCTLTILGLPILSYAGLWDDIKKGTESIKRGAQDLKQSLQDVEDTKETVDEITPESKKDNQQPTKQNRQSEWVSNPVVVRQAQMRLKRLGYDVTVDGSYGPGTRTAIMQFQSSQDMPVTGDLSQELLVALAKARPSMGANSTSTSEIAKANNSSNNSLTSAARSSYGDVVFLGTTRTDSIGYYLISLNQEVLDDDETVRKMSYILEGRNVLVANTAIEREKNLKEARKKLLMKANEMYPNKDVTFGMILPVNVGDYDKHREGFPIFADTQAPRAGWSLASAGNCDGELCFVGRHITTRVPVSPRYDSSVEINFLESDQHQYQLLAKLSRISAVVLFKISKVKPVRMMDFNPTGMWKGVIQKNLADIEIQKVDLYKTASAKVDKVELSGFITNLPLELLDNDFVQGKDYKKIDLGEGFKPIYLPKMNGRYLVGVPLENGLHTNLGYRHHIKDFGRYPDIFTEGWERYFELFALKDSIMQMANAQANNFSDQISKTQLQLVMRHFRYLPEWHYGEPGKYPDEFARYENSKYFQQKLAPQLASLPNLLPIPMLDVMRVFLSEYDFQSKRFTFSNIDQYNLSTAYPSSGSLDTRAFKNVILAYSQPDPMQAKAFLERMQSSRQVYLAKEYTLQQLGSYIQKHPIGDSGAPLGRLEKLALYEDMQLGRLLSNIGTSQSLTNSGVSQAAVASSAVQETSKNSNNLNGARSGSQPASSGGNCGNPNYVPAAAYPIRASSRNSTGIVSLEIHIGSDGQVSDAKILREEPQGWEFGKSAIKATQRMQWPAGNGFTCKGSWIFTPPQSSSFR